MGATWCIPFNSRAPIVAQFIVKAQRKISQLVTFSGCKALIHANSDRIIYFNKNGGGMAVQSQCALRER